MGFWRGICSIHALAVALLALDQLQSTAGRGAGCAWCWVRPAGEVAQVTSGWLHRDTAGSPDQLWPLWLCVFAVQCHIHRGVCTLLLWENTFPHTSVQHTNIQSRWENITWEGQNFMAKPVLAVTNTHPIPPRWQFVVLLQVKQGNPAPPVTWESIIIFWGVTITISQGTFVNTGNSMARSGIS